MKVFHLSNEGFFSRFPLLLLVSFGCSFKFLGFQKKLSFENGDYFFSVIVLVNILYQFFCYFVQVKQFEICVPCCGDSNCSTCKWKLQTITLPFWQLGCHGFHSIPNVNTVILGECNMFIMLLHIINLVVKLWIRLDEANMINCDLNFLWLSFSFKIILKAEILGLKIKTIFFRIFF